MLASGFVLSKAVPTPDARPNDLIQSTPQSAIHPDLFFREVFFSVIDLELSKERSRLRQWKFLICFPASQRLT